MAHFAHINENSIVDNVIVAEQDFIDTLADKDLWLQTSYNTFGGVNKDGNEPLRKNYAGIGYSYDSVKDAFIAPQPFPSWTIDDTTCLWQAPTPRPDDGKEYIWNEEILSWEQILS